MGWNPFKSKKKTIVGTSVSRVCEDEMLPDSIKLALLRNLNASPSGDLVDDILEEMVGSIGPRCERMYEYAKNNYTYGLPSTQLHMPSEAIAQVDGVLEALEGAPVTVEYSQFGTINLLHLGWTALLAQKGYNPDTNQLMGITVDAVDPHPFLKDMVVVVPDAEFALYNPESLNQYGLAPTAGPCPGRMGTGWISQRQHSPIERTTLNPNEHVRVTYAWWGTKQEYGDNGWVTVPDIKTAEIEINLDVLASNAANYFHVKYVVGGVTKYWLYEYGAGTYPILDAVFESGHAQGGQFFPWVYFRFNKTNQADGNMGHYASSKKVLKYLGMDYDEMAEAINTNPDIGDVEQAMLMFAVPAVTSSQFELRYLFDFFNSLHGNSGTAFSPTQAVIQDQVFNNALVIQDARFKMILGNEGIYKRTVHGSIGAIDTYTVHTGFEAGVPYTVTTSNDSGTTTETITPSIQVHYYRKQVTASLYEEIKVLSLSSAFNVIDGYYATAGEADAPIIMVPIDRSITKEYSIPYREKLYARALHFVFNSVQIVKIRWYQQTWFKFVLIIVAVVIIVISLGSATGPMAALMTAIAAGSAAAITAALIALAIDLVIGILIGLALKLFVKIVGIKIAFIVAIISAVVAFYTMDFSNMAAVLQNSPWASQLLQISSGLVNAIQGELKDLMGNLIEEGQLFTALVSEQDKALAEANKLLDTRDRYLSPFVILGESPNAYYNRTVHSGNIGIVGISAISSFVDTALKLPELSQTLGDAHE